MSRRSALQSLLLGGAAVIALVLGPVVPAVAAGGTIVGTATSVAAGWDNAVTGEIYATSGLLVASAPADPTTGQFQVVVPAGTYTVVFRYTGAGNFLSRFWSGGNGLSAGAPLTVTDGSYSGITQEISLGGSISGVLSSSTGSPLPEMWVFADYGGYPGRLTQPRYQLNAVTGEYVVDRLERNAWLRLSGGFGWSEVHELVPVAVGQAVTGVNRSVAPVSGIRGTVYGQTPMEPFQRAVQIVLYRDGSQVATAASSPQHPEYVFNDIGPGRYTVRFGGSEYVPVWWDGGTGTGEAAEIVLASGESRSMIDGSVLRSTNLGGSVTANVIGTPAPMLGAEVTLYRELDDRPDSYDMVTRMSTGPDGVFWFNNLMPGNYIVRVDDLVGDLGTEYWPDSRFFSTAGVIEVVAGEDIKMLETIELRARYIEISRLTGTDRFGTAIKATKFAFPGSNVGVPVVYIANALNYPDALSAGPAAVAQGGALLTVTPTSIPADILTELNRLDPEKIIVVGGPTMVSDAVIAQLKAQVPSSGNNVVRVTGTNRYQTSNKIARGAFAEGSAPDVFIATGNNFPDALAVGPAASIMGSPVLLINGSATSLDPETMALLDYLGANRAFIIGGPPSVSYEFEDSLSEYLGYWNVVRITGSNRYETALAINQSFFYESEYAFLATGADFADALGGGALAGSLGAPLYLGVQECFLPYVAQDVIDINVQEVVLLGGPTRLGPAVENGQLCQ